MSKILTYSFKSTDLTETGNQLKEIFLEKMKKEGHITEEQESMMNQYCFVLCEKSYFGKLWNKLWSNDEKDVKIIIVKIME